MPGTPRPILEELFRVREQTINDAPALQRKLQTESVAPAHEEDTAEAGAPAQSKARQRAHPAQQAAREDREYSGYLYRQQERYSDPGEAAALYQARAPFRADYDDFQKNATISNKWAAQKRDDVPGNWQQTYAPDAISDDVGRAAYTRASQAKAAVQADLGALARQHPIFNEDGATRGQAHRQGQAGDRVARSARRGRAGADRAARWRHRGGARRARRQAVHHLQDDGKARTITRRAYGFHSAHGPIALLKLCCSGIHLDPVHIDPGSTHKT